MISKGDVEKIAHLSRLDINEDKVEAMQNHFNNVINYFQALQELDTEQVEPMVTTHDIYPGLRADKVGNNNINVEQVLENAPEVKDSLFKVPPVV